MYAYYVGEVTKQITVSHKGKKVRTPKLTWKWITEVIYRESYDGWKIE